jgi:putative endonuclease
LVPFGRSAQDAPRQERARRGYVGHRSGLSAEDSVQRHYQESGCTIAAARWRSAAGEIDLIVREGAVVVFVEVKKARSHEAAAERLSAGQIARIYRSASLYLAGEPAGELTDVRFDLALVDGVGRVDIVQNALAA